MNNLPLLNVCASLCWWLVGLVLPPWRKNGRFTGVRQQAHRLAGANAKRVLLHRTTRRVTITEEGERILNGRSGFCRMSVR